MPGFSFGELNNLQSFADLIDDQTAAILVETIQGESGINPCTPEFLRGLRQLCDQHNLLLMLDEVQCGIGRTGKFYAFEHAGVQPDAIGMAKGLGGGFPIGAIWVRDRFAGSVSRRGHHGTTFGGTPLACAAATCGAGCDRTGKASRESHRAQRPLDRGVCQARDGVSETADRRSRQRLTWSACNLRPITAPYLTALREHGLLVAGAGGNAIRVLPPLIATAEELARSVEIFREVLKAKS